MPRQPFVYGRERQAADPLVAEAVRRGRQRMGLSQRELAKRSGVGHAMIAYVEANERWASDRLLARLADVLEPAPPPPPPPEPIPRPTTCPLCRSIAIMHIPAGTWCLSCHSLTPLRRPSPIDPPKDSFFHSHTGELLVAPDANGCVTSDQIDAVMRANRPRTWTYVSGFLGPVR